MKYQWLCPYFGEKVIAEYVEINPEHIVLSMMGMESELKLLTRDENRKKREKLEIIIKEMAAILTCRSTSNTTKD